jgi:DNA-binding IclR family transcriptional regulator
MADLGKVHRIFCALQQEPQFGLSNQAISKQLAIPPATSYRILQELCKYDLVYKRPHDAHYFFGSALLGFAQCLLATSDEISICRPFLDKLHRSMNHTVFYSKFNGNFCVVMDVRGPANPRIAVALGEVMPMHCSAAGKAVLAFLTSNERAELYKKIKLENYTQNTLGDIDELEKQLQEINEAHIAYNFSEFHEGINAFSAPVFNRMRSVAGSITVVGTSTSLSLDIMQHFGPTLVSISRQLSNNMVLGMVQ